VLFVSYLIKDLSDFKPSPTCDVPSSHVCDGGNDCDDNSDEIGCQCPGDMFQCDYYQSDDGCAGWRGGCIEQWEVCWGVNSCGDWSDEKYCLNTKLYCTNQECIERSNVNDGKIDMTGEYDEFLCCVTRVISVDAFQIMTIVAQLESVFPTFGSVRQEMIVPQAIATNHVKQLKLVGKISRLYLIDVQQMKAKCLCGKV